MVSVVVVVVAVVVVVIVVVVVVGLVVVLLLLVLLVLVLGQDCCLQALLSLFPPGHSFPPGPAVWDSLLTLTLPWIFIIYSNQCSDFQYDCKQSLDTL